MVAIECRTVGYRGTPYCLCPLPPPSLLIPCSLCACVALFYGTLHRCCICHHYHHYHATIYPIYPLHTSLNAPLANPIPLPSPPPSTSNALCRHCPRLCRKGEWGKGKGKGKRGHPFNKLAKNVQGNLCVATLCGSRTWS